MGKNSKKITGSPKKKWSLYILSSIIIIVAAFFISSYILGNEGANEEAFFDKETIGDSDYDKADKTKNGAQEINNEQSEINDNNIEIVEPEEIFFDKGLEETVFSWIVSKMGNEDFVLLEINNLPETPEAFDSYQDQQIFVYRSEKRDTEVRTVLIGEPFSDAFYRLSLEEQGGKWVITEEVDLW